MQLTQYSDYSIRVLVYLAAHPDDWATTEQISKAYGVSQNHLVKVVNNLGQNGFVEIKRGRSGGIRLAIAPSAVSIGMVVRKTEPSFRLVECFDCVTNTCPILPVCELKPVLAKALRAFLQVLDDTTLAQLVENRSAYQKILAKNSAK